MLGDLLQSLMRLPLRAGRAKRARALFETAMAQRQARDYESARRSFEQSLTLDPDNAQAHLWLGTMLAGDSSSYVAAAVHLERALALDPGIENGWIDLGIVYYFQRDLVKAGACFRAAVDADPGSAMASLNLGVVLKESGRLGEALEHIRRAYELAPETDGALRNMVSILIETDNRDEALSVAVAAIARNPTSYEAHLLLGFVYQKSDEPARALALYEDLASRMPTDDAEYYYNRGVALQDLGRMQEALADYERALSLKPDYPLAAFHRGLTRLLLGDFERGWADYEWRRQSGDFHAGASGLPPWDGSALAGRTILVRNEQGLGDEIMFSSMFPQLIEAAGHCTIECEAKLLGLFTRSFPRATVIPSTTGDGMRTEPDVQGVNWEVAAGSLPGFFRRRLADFPRHRGYLKADPGRVERWRERLSQLDAGLKVGISWKGGVRKTRRALRSIPPDLWQPILRTPSVRFVSLQYGSEAAAAAASMHEAHGVPIEHWPDAIEDYDETAALVCALDLVISVCTAVIHLGGALGRPVWVMAPYSPEWRYGFSGDTMPWYPSVKVFRQPAFGEWAPVTTSVAAQLRQLSGAPGG